MREGSRASRIYALLSANPGMKMRDIYTTLGLSRDEISATLSVMIKRGDLVRNGTIGGGNETKTNVSGYCYYLNTDEYRHIAKEKHVFTTAKKSDSYMINQLLYSVRA